MFFVFFIISILSGIGMAIALVEKGNDFPIKKYRIYLQMILKKIHWKLPQMLFCSTCTSFWTTALCDIILCLIGFFIFGQFYFLWPLSGFASVGITWTIIEFLNALDKKQNINISFSEDENEN